MQKDFFLFELVVKRYHQDREGGVQESEVVVTVYLQRAGSYHNVSAREGREAMGANAWLAFSLSFHPGL